MFLKRVIGKCQLSLILVLGIAAAGAEPTGKLDGVAFTVVKITDAFWGLRIEINRKNTVWHDIAKCEETGRIDNFAKAAGLMEGEFKGIYFDDSDVYKVLEGAAYSLSNQRDPELEKKVDEIIDKIAAAQQDDGYLMSYYILTGMDKRWTNLHTMHELYCAGHMFEAAVAYYRATGKQKFLGVARRVADHIDSIFGTGKRSDVPGHEEIELALVKLWEVTGEQRYLNLAKFFLDERGTEHGRKKYGAYCQDHAPVREQSEIMGHAVRAMYLYAGVADIVGLTGDQGYARAMGRLWDNLTRSKLYVTGGIGASHAGEAFGGEYYLPNESAYAETCAAIGLALWSHRLNLLHRDASYFDVFERTLYNGLLSGVSLDGKKFFYVNPLEADGDYKFNQGSNSRAAWYGCSCCPSNVVRFIPSVSGYVYAQDETDIFVNMYVGSTAKVTLKNGSVNLVQQTRYPWDGRVLLRVEPEVQGEFAINLRIPGWCRGEPLATDLYRFEDEVSKADSQASLKINKTATAINVHNGYARIERKWKPGDVIELSMPMPVRRVAAHEKVEADRGKVALQRGPIVYCLEEVDNEGLDHVYLPGDKELNGYHVEMLGGVMAIGGRAMARLRQGDGVREVDVVAVPYYSWNNRGPGKMKVWLPVDKKYLKEIPKPTIASQSKVTVSHCWVTDAAKALNDQKEPSNSHDNNIPRMTWWDHKGSTEWMQYDFAEQTKVAGVEVYWFDDAPGGGCRIPQSWRVMYNKGGQWKEVTGASDYAVKKDAYNKVTFEAVETESLRVEVELQTGYSGGVLEWKILNSN